MIFPWHMGYSLLYTRLEIFQLAEGIGFEGLSFLLLLFSAGSATAWLTYQTRKSKGLVYFSGLLLAFFFLNVSGALLRPDNTPAQTLKVLLIQANIGQFDKIQGEIQLKGRAQGEVQQIVQDRYINLTEKALQTHPEAEVILWPETALADYLDLEYLSRARALQLRDRIRAWNRALLTGAYSRDFGTERVYNGLFTFAPEGSLTGPAFRKSQLLAFGERLPFGDVFPWLYKLLPFVSSFQAGAGPAVQSLVTKDKTYQVASQICYESLFPWFSRKGSELGAHLIVNVTNDSWFGTTFEPFQHGTMTWARAIENRKPLVRATNTGQSSVISHRGDVLIKSPLNQEWFGLAEVEVPDSRQTFYTRWGHLDWVVLIVILLILWLTYGGSKFYARKLSQ